MSSTVKSFALSFVSRGYVSLKICMNIVCSLQLLLLLKIPILPDKYVVS